MFHKAFVTWRRILAFALVFSLAAACSTVSKLKRGESCNHHYGRLDGRATVYADKFEGRSTACGQSFHQSRISGAIKATTRRSLFSDPGTFCNGLYAIVTNTQNGAVLKVPIIDTGGMPNAVIDLSERAARELGIRGEGEVKFELCRE